MVKSTTTTKSIPSSKSNKTTRSPSHHGKREGSRRELHSQIERRRREKINDRLLVLRNTVPACALLMAGRSGDHKPIIKGPLAHRYNNSSTCDGRMSTLTLPNANVGSSPEPTQPVVTSSCQEEELGLNKLDVLIHTVDYIFELHGYIDELLETQRCMKQELKQYRTLGTSKDREFVPGAVVPTQDHHSLWQYSLSSTDNASKQRFLQPCIPRRNPYTTLYPETIPELVQSNHTGGRDSIVSDKSSSLGLQSPCSPTMRSHEDARSTAVNRLPSPFSLPLPMTTSDVNDGVPVHLPFPSVLMGKRPETTPEQLVSDNSPNWSAMRPHSSSASCLASLTQATSPEAPSHFKPGEEDAQLLMDLHTPSISLHKQPQPHETELTRTHSYDNNYVQDEKKRHKVRTMAVNSLLVPVN